MDTLKDLERTKEWESFLKLPWRNWHFFFLGITTANMKIFEYKNIKIGNKYPSNDDEKSPGFQCALCIYKEENTLLLLKNVQGEVES